MITNNLQVLPNDVVGIIRKLVKPTTVYHLVCEESYWDGLDRHEYESLGIYSTLDLAVISLLGFANISKDERKKNVYNRGTKTWIYHQTHANNRYWIRDLKIEEVELDMELDRNSDNNVSYYLVKGALYKYQHCEFGNKYEDWIYKGTEKFIKFEFEHD
jgi:hypothetical protein